MQFAAEPVGSQISEGRARCSRPTRRIDGRADEDETAAAAPSRIQTGAVPLQTQAPIPGRERRRAAYAALDLGTNNCRLLVAEPTFSGFRVIDAFSRIVRLGEDSARPTA